MSGSSGMEADCSKSSNRDSGNDRFIPERGFYQPSTDETIEAYQAIISIIQCYGERNSDMTNCVVAQEILSILKSESMTESIYQRSEIKKILPNIPDSFFEMLVTSAALLTDYPKVVQTDISPVDQRDNSILDLPTDGMGWLAYNSFLDEIISTLGAEPDDLYILAHYTLSILKNKTLSRSVKHTEIENVLGKVILPEKFNLLESVGGSIFDNNSDDCGPSVVNPTGGDGWDSDGLELNKEVIELTETMGLTGLDSCPKKSAWEPDGIKYEWGKIHYHNESIDEHGNGMDRDGVPDGWGKIYNDQNKKNRDGVPNGWGKIHDDQNGMELDGVPDGWGKIYNDQNKKNRDGVPDGWGKIHDQKGMELDGVPDGWEKIHDDQNGMDLDGVLDGWEMINDVHDTIDEDEKHN